MRAGLLRHTAVFERAVETRDASGGVVRDWQAQFNRRFRIAKSSGREFLAAKQTTAEMTHLFVFRVLPDTASNLVKMRIVYDARVFEILSAIDMNGRQREVQISVKEIL